MALQGSWHCKRMLFVESVKVKNQVVVSNHSYSKHKGTLGRGLRVKEGWYFCFSLHFPPSALPGYLILLALN